MSSISVQSPPGLSRLVFKDVEEDYVLEAGDEGKVIKCIDPGVEGETPKTRKVTLPGDATANLPIGARIGVLLDSAVQSGGRLQLIPAVGVGLNVPGSGDINSNAEFPGYLQSNGPFANCFLFKLGVDEWQREYTDTFTVQGT